MNHMRMPIISQWYCNFFEGKLKFTRSRAMWSLPHPTAHCCWQNLSWNRLEKEKNNSMRINPKLLGDYILNLFKRKKKKLYFSRTHDFAISDKTQCLPLLPVFARSATECWPAEAPTSWSPPKDIVENTELKQGTLAFVSFSFFFSWVLEFVFHSPILVTVLWPKITQWILKAIQMSLIKPNSQLTGRSVPIIHKQGLDALRLYELILHSNFSSCLLPW